MHAIVLVGGFGTRLRPLTDTVPKSMLTVGNEPIITRLVRRLERRGVTTVTLSLGFLPDPFRAAFPDGRCGGVELRYAVEPEPLDTAGAIRFAADVRRRRRHVPGDQRRRHHRPRRRRARRRASATRRRGDDPPDAGRRSVGVRCRRDRRRRPRPAVPREAAAGVTDSKLINGGTYVMEPTRARRDRARRRRSTSSASRSRCSPPAGRCSAWRPTTTGSTSGAPSCSCRRTSTGWPGATTRRWRTRSAVATASIRTPSSPSTPCSPAVSWPRDVEVGSRSVVTRSVLLAGARIGDDVVVQDSVVMGARRRSERSCATRSSVPAPRSTRGSRSRDERLPDPG